MQNPKTPIQARKEYIYLRAFHDFQFFITTFFPHHCGYPFSPMHHDFFAAELDPARRGRREVIAAPRGHAKTTFKVMFKCLHAILYGYEPFIVIIGHSAPEAEGKVRDILEELETNELLQEIFGALAPIQGQAGWSKKNFVSQNGIRVMAKSRGKQVRGLKHGMHRPSLIILDDIESPDKVLNENQRYKTQQWLEKDILKLGNVDGKANVMVIGTCLHPEALLPTLLASPGWQGKKYQAVLAFANNQALWQKWKALYTNLSNPKREQAAQIFLNMNRSAMLEGAAVLWPEAEPYENLQKMIINEGQASFQSEKQNDPYDPTRQIFDMDRAKYFKIEYLENGKVPCVRWQDGSKRFTLMESMERIVMFHDPALGESVDGDYAALVVCAIDKDGYIYCLDAYLEKVAPSRQIEQAFAFHKKWKVQTLYLEENNFQGILKPSYYKSIQENNSSLRISGITQHHNKEKRIASLEPLITNGQLLFNQDLNPRMISQIKLFPTGHDDGPDALHGAVEQLRKRLGRF